MPVCITGMHRSGTSMVAHALACCGLDFGSADALLPGNEWNRDGYWENRVLVELSDWLLEELGGAWDAPPSASPSRRRGLAAVLAQRAREIVASGGFGEPWAWKDPRVSLLADLWAEALGNVRFVIVVRTPIEVALSLQRRGAVSPHLGLSLWGAYYDALVELVPPSDRVVVEHGAFMANPRSVLQRLVAALSLDADEKQLERAADVVDTTQRHHASRPEELALLPATLVERYRQLTAEACDGNAAAFRPVAAEDAFSLERPPAVRVGQLLASYQERDLLRSEAAGLARDRDNWREQAAALEEDRARWRERAESAEGNREALEARAKELASTSSRLAEELADQRARIVSLETELDQRRANASAGEQLAQEAGQLQERLAGVAKHRDDLQVQLDEVAERASRLELERYELRKRAAEGEELARELVQLRDRLEAASGRVAQLEREVEQRDKWSAGLESDRDAWRKRALHVEGMLESSQGEVDRLIADRDRYAQLLRDADETHAASALRSERLERLVADMLATNARQQEAHRRDAEEREEFRARAEAAEKAQQLANEEGERWRERAEATRHELERRLAELDARATELNRASSEQNRLAAEAASLQEQLEAVAAASAAVTTEHEAIAADRDEARTEASRLADDRNAWREEASRLLVDRDNWRAETRRLTTDRDNWRVEAGNWRRETERLIDREQRRIRAKLRRRAFRLARVVWWAAPRVVRDRLRPILFPGSRKRALPATSQEHEQDAATDLVLPPRGTAIAPARTRGEIGCTVSIVVPTLNGGDDVRRFLAALERQVGVPDLELVIADSGSTDGTREVFGEAGAVILDISPDEFGHGRTRNAAVAASRGEVVVMMVQDALLLSPRALHDLVDQLLRQEKVAAVSARQIPRSDADLYAAFNVVSHYRALWRDAHRSSNGALGRRAAAGVDDVCAALRRSAWEDVQYRDVEFAEDLDFGLRAVERGWTVDLSDRVAVAHSHTRDVSYQFRRSIADRLNVAPLIGDDSIARSAELARRTGTGNSGAVIAAGRLLTRELAAALAFDEVKNHDRLSVRLRHVERALASPAMPIEPSGALARLEEFFSAVDGTTPDETIVVPLRREMCALLEWPLLQEFAEAQRGVPEAATRDFVAKLCATAVGRSAGDLLRTTGAHEERRRLLQGV